MSTVTWRVRLGGLLSAILTFGALPAQADVLGSDDSIHNRFSGKCLAIWHTYEEGAPAFQSQCAAYPDQKWTPRYTDSGFYQFVNQFSGKCLAIWHTYDEGAPVFQSHCNAEYKDQHWSMYYMDGGWVQLYNRFSSKCLAIWHTHDEGARAFQSRCVDTYTDQHWKTSAL